MTESINEAITETPEVKETQEKKERKPKAEVRNTEIENSLQDLGLDTKDMSNDEMIKTLIKKTVEMRDKVIEKQLDKEQQMIKGYAEGNDVVLTDQDFIYRLRMMNVSKRYLHLFRDHDKVMKDLQIWKRIRHSGVTPFDRSVSSILSGKK